MKSRLRILFFFTISLSAPNLLAVQVKTLDKLNLSSFSQTEDQNCTVGLNVNGIPGSYHKNWLWLEVKGSDGLFLVPVESSADIGSYSKVDPCQIAKIASRRTVRERMQTLNDIKDGNLELHNARNGAVCVEKYMTLFYEESQVISGKNVRMAELVNSTRAAPCPMNK